MQQTHTPNDFIQHYQLATGCDLTVLAAADTQQCALALSFGSGSYYEPKEYLGMAHFLEHLVFRGSKNYALDEGLMAFIQRSGGHVNAQTQAQQTLFHFQVESPLFVEALKRLVDMLVAPRLEPAMLSSEREVLNEEFGLYCRAPQILMDAAIAPCLLNHHPLQRFYAGNRKTLRIEDYAFTSALAEFHQAAYLRSPLKIVLVIPNDWQSWQEQVLSILQPLTTLQRNLKAQQLPELRVPVNSKVRLSLPVDEEYLVLHIPINQQAQGLFELAEKTQHALALAMEQTFLAYVQQLGWCSAIHVRAAFYTQAQGVLTVQFASPPEHHAVMLPAFTQWLSQWRKQLMSAEQQAYEQQAQRHRWLVAEPLRKAQQVLSSGWPLQGGAISDCLAALDAVLGAVVSGAFVQVVAGAAAVDGFYNQGLPLNIECYQQNETIADVAVSVPLFSFPCHFTNSLSHLINQSAAIPLNSPHIYKLSQFHPVYFPKGLAVCYWGWLVTNAHDIAQRLPSQLAELSELLSYNAVHWQTESVHDAVFIRVTGPATFLPIAVNQILAVLESPLTDAVVVPGGHFALRRLLQRLPAALAGAQGSTDEPEIALAGRPQTALWLGAVDGATLLKQNYLQRLQTFSAVTNVPAAAIGWQQVKDSGSDDALLVVYIPMPATGIAEQDRMRMINRVFAQHFQTALQRYLRDELALCYAVFVLPYAQGDYEGLSCSVQSSKVSAAQLFDEIRQYLACFKIQFSGIIETLQAEVAVQAEQLEQGVWGLERQSQMLFRHWRELRLELGLQEEIQAVLHVDKGTIEKYCLTLAEHSKWLILSNQTAR